MTITKKKTFAMVILSAILAFTAAFAFSSPVYAAQGDYQAKQFKVTQSGGSKKVAKDAKLTFRGTEKNKDVKVTVLYKKSGKWAYHSTITIKTGSKSDGNKVQPSYGGSKTISGKRLTKGVKYRAEARDYGGKWYVEWTAK